MNLASVEQAKLEAQASVWELQGFVQSLLADTEVAYWNFVLATEEIAIFESALSVAERELYEVEQRIDVGTVPELEAAPFRAEVAQRQQALIEAESRREAARLRLNRFVSPDPTGRLDVEIRAVSSPDFEERPEPVPDAADRIELADRYRPDLEEARLRLEQNRLQTVVTRNGVLPRLDVFLAFGKTGFSDTVEGTFGAMGENTYDVQAGLRLSHFLANRAARAADEGARTRRRQSLEAIENLRQLAHLQVRLALNELERARAQIEASTTTRILQQDVVRGEKVRFEVGTGTSLQVAQAQRALLVSRIAEVRAVVDYRIARVRLHVAEGTLVWRRGVRIAAQ